MHNHKPNLQPTTELMGAIIADTLDEASVSTLKTDPKAALYAYSQIDIADTLKINIVENSDQQVRLILPYYQSIDNVKTQLLEHADLETVSGGEIIFGLIFGSLLGVAFATSVGVGATATTVGAVVGGTIGAAVGIATIGTAIGISERSKSK